VAQADRKLYNESDPRNYQSARGLDRLSEARPVVAPNWEPPDPRQLPWTSWSLASIDPSMAPATLAIRPHAHERSNPLSFVPGPTPPPLLGNELVLDLHGRRTRMLRNGSSPRRRLKRIASPYPDCQLRGVESVTRQCRFRVATTSPDDGEAVGGAAAAGSWKLYDCSTSYSRHWVSTCRRAQQPLSGSQREYAWQRPPAAIAAEQPLATCMSSTDTDQNRLTLFARRALRHSSKSQDGPLTKRNQRLRRGKGAPPWSFIIDADRAGGGKPVQNSG
jgi:hypothetical protein